MSIAGLLPLYFGAQVDVSGIAEVGAAAREGSSSDDGPPRRSSMDRSVPAINWMSAGCNLRDAVRSNMMLGIIVWQDGNMARACLWLGLVYGKKRKQAHIYICNYTGINLAPFYGNGSIFSAINKFMAVLGWRVTPRHRDISSFC